MNKTLHMVCALGAISLVSGVSLAGIFVLTDPLIQKQELAAKTRMAMEVLPNADFHMDEKGGSADRFEGFGKDGNPVGVVYVTKGRGYGGPMDVIVGLSDDGTIRGVMVGKNSETPGLGSRVSEVKYGETAPWFTKQFQGVTLQDFDSGTFKLDAITGATISSKAVAGAVGEALQRLTHEPFYKKAG